MKINYNVSFWVLLAAVFIAKVFYIGWGPLDLVPDEAHYWGWSRHPDFSYYSKGPFIAYNIFMGVKFGDLTGLCPPNPAFWVRFPAVLNSTVLGIIAWLLSNKIWKDKRVSFYVILILTSLPIYVVGSIIMTVDNPLMLFWVFYIYFVFAALEKERGMYWYLSGIMLGLGFLSKYTMIILIPSAILYLATTAKHRFWFKRKEFYISILIASLFFLPVFLWNIKYNWIGIRHLIGQAGLAKGRMEEPFFTPFNLLEFIGMQFGVISPVLFVLIIFGFIKAWLLRKDYRYNFLFWTGVPLGIFYLALSLHEYCQANWPAPAYLTGAVLAGNIFCGKKILKIGILLGIVMSLIVFGIDLLPFVPNRLDPTIRARGWKKLGQDAGKTAGDFSKEGNLFIFSDTYQITSELAFYVPGQPETFCVNLGRRINQYDLWQDFDKLKGLNAIYVKHRDQEAEKEIKDAFISFKKLPLVNIEQGKRLLHQYSIFLCKGFKGFKPKTDEVTY